MSEHERSFEVFGTRVRLLIGEAGDATVLGPRATAIHAEGVLRMMHRDLTRFEPGSAFSVLNADRGETVSA